MNGLITSATVSGCHFHAFQITMVMKTVVSSITPETAMP